MERLVRKWNDNIIVLPVAGEKWFDGEEAENEDGETDELNCNCCNGE